MPKDNAFGPRVRELRQERGITLDEMAVAVGISASHLSRMERGMSAPSFMLASRLAAALGVQPSELATIQRDQGAVNHELVATLAEAGMELASALEITRKISTTARRVLLDVLTKG